MKTTLISFFASCLLIIEIYGQSGPVFVALPSGADCVRMQSAITLVIIDLPPDKEHDLMLWDGERGSWTFIDHVNAGKTQIIWYVGDVSGKLFRLFLLDRKTREVQQCSPAYFAITERGSTNGEYTNYTLPRQANIEYASLEQLEFQLNLNSRVLRCTLHDLQGRLLHDSQSVDQLLFDIRTWWTREMLFITVTSERDGDVIESRYVGGGR